MPDKFALDAENRIIRLSQAPGLPASLAMENMVRSTLSASEISEILALPADNPVRIAYQAAQSSVSSLLSPGAGIPASLRFCIPGRNPNTLFSDVSGLGADLTPEPANTGAFAKPGYFRSIAGTDAGLTIPAAKTLWTPSRQSMALAFVVNANTPAAAQNLLGWGAVFAAGNVGLYTSLRPSTGAIRIVPNVNGVALTSLTDSSLSFTDSPAVSLSGTFTGTTGNATLTYSTTLPPEVVVGSMISGAAGVPAGSTISAINRATNVVTISSNLTADVTAVALTVKPVVDHHCLIAFDAPSGSWYIYCDGVTAGAYTNVMTGANAFPAGVQTLAGLRWGGFSGSGVTTIAAAGYGLQGYIWDGPLPPQVGVGAQLLAANLSATARAPLNPLVA